MPDPPELAAADASGGRALRLHLYPLLGAFGDAQGPLPWVQDALGRQLQQSWRLWVEVAPSDARALGIDDGARVRVESEEAAVEARAKIYAGVRPGVAAMPVGPGGTAGPTCQRALAENPVALVGGRRGASGAERLPGTTWVRIRRV